MTKIVSLDQVRRLKKRDKMRDSTDKTEQLQAELDYRTAKIVEELEEIHERLDYLEGNLRAMFKVLQDFKPEDLSSSTKKEPSE